MPSLPNATCNQTNNTINILQSATLFITMTVQPDVKSKKRTKYRPVQRPDGVIVLQRPYRPATSSSSSPQMSTFEKHLPTFIVPASTARPKLVAATKRMDDELTGMGSCFLDMDTNGPGDMVKVGRGGYQDLVVEGTGCYQDLLETGRDGYNDLLEKHDGTANFTKELRRSRTDYQSTPMQRFLSGPESWSVLQLRNV
jgi:hypothetical protein